MYETSEILLYYGMFYTAKFLTTIVFLGGQ